MILVDEFGYRVLLDEEDVRNNLEITESLRYVGDDKTIKKRKACKVTLDRRRFAAVKNKIVCGNRPLVLDSPTLAVSLQYKLFL